ncbi:MAG: hypothetical protein R3C10_20530 [Pirellulales bacterium]
MFGRGIHDPTFGVCTIDLAAVASRTGRRAESYRQSAAGRVAPFVSYTGDNSGAELVASDVDFVCVATPDDRHFDSAMAALKRVGTC